MSDAYAGQKFALTGSLPIGHPYKTVPPTA